MVHGDAKMIDVGKVQGIGEFEAEELVSNDAQNVTKGSLYEVPGGKAFLVDWGKTIEVRTDGRLAQLLMEKYESVMRSRYFGKGGVEVVMSGQLADSEIEDLVRLSYNLTLEETTS